MGLKKWYERKKLERELERANRRSDQYVENSSPEARSELAYAYADAAKAKIGLGHLTGNREYFREAAETYDAAARAADQSITARGSVAKMFRDFRDDAEKSFESREGGKEPGLHYSYKSKTDKSWHAKEGDIDPKTKRRHTGLKIGDLPGDIGSGGLEGTLAIASIVGILAGIFFLSSNITGNAIADMTTKTTSFLGAGLLIVGLVAGAFALKNKVKKKK
jgi:hypothetical protein